MNSLDLFLAAVSQRFPAKLGTAGNDNGIQPPTPDFRFLRASCPPATGYAQGSTVDQAVLQYLSQQVLHGSDTLSALTTLEGTNKSASGGSLLNASAAESLLRMSSTSSLGMASPSNVPRTAVAANSSSHLPSNLTISAGTDVLNAAGFIQLALSQPCSSSFLLQISPEGPVSVNLAAVNTALKIVAAARKFYQATNQLGPDLGFVPVLSMEPNLTIGQDNLALRVYQVQLPLEVLHSNAQVVKVEPNSNPLMLGLQLSNMVTACSSGAAAEVFFTAQAAKVVVQALAVARINLNNAGLDLILMPQLLDGRSTPALGNLTYYHTKVIRLQQLLQQQAALPFSHSGVERSSSSCQLSGLTHAVSALGSLEQGFGLSDCNSSGNGPDDHGHLAGIAQTLDLQALGSVSSLAMPGLGASKAGSTLVQKPRARKADWVIVTEDTAIKNAAGAIAKVLGRVSNQGLCCPVYTEKKTDKFTTVVSVAVKAIAVARGYVCNEGTRHEVGFQPYLRSPERFNEAGDVQLFFEKKSMTQLNRQHSFGPPGSPTVANQSTMLLLRSSDNSELSPGEEDGLHDDKAELAFDVFKIGPMPEVADAGNLPVKVTAHSRPNVVSNIITKLVTERDTAVLITAGGKAMHVAMMAVVSARARLKSKGTDILLLPKFVTVDTTSTLGWESVFLKFNIVRWASSAGDAMRSNGGSAQPDIGPSRFMLSRTSQ